MSFTPIENQEQLDEVIKDRLNREREKSDAQNEEKNTQIAALEKQVKELKGELENANKKNAEQEKQITDLVKVKSSYEMSALKTRIAHEEGLPYELANRLSGDDEDALREDAQKLSKMIVKPTPYEPPANTEPAGDGADAPYRKMLEGIKPV